MQVPCPRCPSPALITLPRAAGLALRSTQDYVSQRLQRYDAPYCAQAFNLLVHTIGRLQAPARRDATQRQYAKVAELFAAAADDDAGAAAAAEAAPAGGVAVSGSARSKAEPGSGGTACVPAGQHDGEQQVQLHLEKGAGGRMAVRLLLAAAEAAPACADAETLAPATPAAPAAEAEGVQLHLQPRGTGDSVAAILTPASAAAAAAHAETSSGGSGQPAQAGSEGAAGAGEPLRWGLRLAPNPSGDGSVAVIMAPLHPPPTPDAATEHSQPGAPEAAAGPGSSAVSEASIAAVVAAARFMHRQLNELKADVAAAHLALLKGAAAGRAPTQAVPTCLMSTIHHSRAWPQLSAHAGQACFDVPLPLPLALVQCTAVLIRWWILRCLRHLWASPPA